jgi:SAM-dependent methyltransferase
MAERTRGPLAVSTMRVLACVRVHLVCLIERVRIVDTEQESEIGSVWVVESGRAVHGRALDQVSLGEPASWITSHEDRLPVAGRALDVACGRGRHAIWLAQRGLSVQAVDRDAAAVARLASAAQRLQVGIDARTLDLEATPPPSLGHAAFDLIVVINYLHRPLFPALLAALSNGGVLVYETFTRAQALRGKPTNPAFLLEPGELLALTRGLTVLDAREGEFDGRWVASVVARRDREEAVSARGAG